MARAVFIVEQRAGVLGRPLLADPDQVLHTTLEVSSSARQAKSYTEESSQRWWINELNPFVKKYRDVFISK